MHVWAKAKVRKGHNRGGHGEVPDIDFEVTPVRNLIRNLDSYKPSE